MYKDYIFINKNFQSSVNLELDLNSEKKIEEYIPTSDICDVLKRFIKSINSSKSDKATTLVGPYGKGKSFLLLVLSYIISQNPNSKTYKNLLKRITGVDSDLGNEIQSLNKKKTKLLPIIINSNYDNLSQAFMLALNDAINRENLPDIIPETTYSACLDLIKKWDTDADFSRKTLIKCEKELGVSRQKIEMGLKNYSLEAYNQFTTLYNCVTHGMPFNPLINNDVVHIYSEVNYELKKHGYSGMFIIFDEFSKFLESAGDATSKNLKIIQDFAELANRSSSDEQIHICCVTHKSFSLYKDSERADSFKTVEGRFKEIKFNRSLNENYQIISAAIKNDEAKVQIKKFIDDNKEFYGSLKEFEPFESDVNLDDLYYGCFPLNPVTVYSLIQLSELVAQNERTLFTFICDVDDNSLNSFIQRNSDGLFNIDKIYDYFSPLLQHEEENAIRNIWYRSEGTLSKIEDQTQRSIIKALAVILMINDPDNMPANDDNISRSLMLPKETVSAKINELIDERLLRRNIINNLLSFASTNSKEIEDQIQIINQTKENTISFDSVLDEINENRYVLPRRYNEQNKITRFYRVMYITEEQLSNLSSFDLFKERSFADGYILNLIRRKMTNKQIKDSFKRFNDEKVILKYPKTAVNNVLFDEATRYESIQELIKKGGNDSVITSELELLLQEVKENINKIVSDNFEKNFEFISIYARNKTEYKDLLSDHMNKVYSKKIVFNNELVNKNVVTVVYQKAVNNVINDLISKTVIEYSPTSPETTIKNSILGKLDQKDVQEIIKEIKQAILNAEKQKLEIASVVEQYNAEPYGVRKGILTILFAKCVNELSDNILLYLKNKEIELNANNLVKAIYSDGDYYIRSSKGSASQTEYMNNLLKALNIEPANNFRIDNKKLCEGLRRFFVGLPTIIRNVDENNNLQIDDKIINYKKCFMSFSLNPYEIVFEKPLEIFETSRYKIPEKKIIGFIKNWNDYMVNYKNQIIIYIKKTLSIKKDTSLHMGMNALLKEKLGDKKPVLNVINSNIYRTIESLSFDDVDGVNDLANSCLGSFIEDWTIDRSEELVSRIQDFLTEISVSKRIDVTQSSLDNLLKEINYENRSEMGTLFQNGIESVIEEFGDSISSEEKIAILSSLLKKYL